MTVPFRSLALAAALVATATLAAGASAAPRADAPGANLVPVKTYLLDHTTRLHGLHQAVPCRRQPLLRRREARGLRLRRRSWHVARAVRADLARGRRASGSTGNPYYEHVEGVVAGTPSLAVYDVILDAGSSAAEDPGERRAVRPAAPERQGAAEAGQPLQPHRGHALGHAAGVRRRARPTSTATEGASSARCCPTRTPSRPRPTRSRSTPASSTAPRARGSRRPSDAFTAVVVMVPTMSEYFGQWKTSRFVLGDQASSARSTSSRASPTSATSSAASASSTRASGPAIAQVDAAQAAQTKRELDALWPYVAQAARAGASGQALHAAAGRRARPRRAGAGDGDRRPGDAGGGAPQGQDRPVERCAPRPGSRSSSRRASRSPRRRPGRGSRGTAAADARDGARRTPRPSSCSEGRRSGARRRRRGRRAAVERARRAEPPNCGRARCARAARDGGSPRRRARVRRGPRRGAGRRSCAPRFARGRGRGRARRRRGRPLAGCSCASSGRRRGSRAPRPTRRSRSTASADGALAARRSRGGRPQRPARHLRRPATLVARRLSRAATLAGFDVRERRGGRGAAGYWRSSARPIGRSADPSRAAEADALFARSSGERHERAVRRPRSRRVERALEGFRAAPLARRRAAAPRRSARALPRARADRVRPRRRGRPRRARLRDPGGDHVPRRRRRRVRRPRVDPARAETRPRRAASARRSPRSATRSPPRRAATRVADPGRGATRTTDRRARVSPRRSSRSAGGGGRDRRLRRDRGDARPRPGGGRRRGVGPSRAGAPRGLRRLRARPGAAAARARAERSSSEVEGSSGTATASVDGLVQLAQAQGDRGGDRRRRGAALDAALEDAEAADRRRPGLARLHRHEQRDHRLPRGARGGADPRRADGEPGRRAATAPAPLLGGVGFALVASVVTWVVAQTVLGSLAGWGEKLEAVVSLVAIGVLLLILNWFYHRVYWQENLQDLHKRKKRDPRRRAASASSRRRRSGSSRSASRASTARASRPCSSCRR